jgi:hypothetical protein
MADKEFDDAKLIYDLLAKSGKGVSEDAINEIARTLDISISNEKLKERIERLGRGLPSEDEFIALAIWFGKCKLIHKLDQEQFPSISAQNYQVPDLCAVFEYEGREIPVLIEVKSESTPKSSNPKLRLANKLYKNWEALLFYSVTARLRVRNFRSLMCMLTPPVTT